MTTFVDASVLVSIIGEETDAEMFEAALERAPDRITSGIALWETARALAKRTHGDMRRGLEEASRYCAELAIAVVPIGAPEASGAVAAQIRYGNGSGHPARLNMGDCFAYACAKTNNARLLYKGGDFVHTDLK